MLNCWNTSSWSGHDPALEMFGAFVEPHIEPFRFNISVARMQAFQVSQMTERVDTSVTLVVVTSDDSSKRVWVWWTMKASHTLLQLTLVLLANEMLLFTTRQCPRKATYFALLFLKIISSLAFTCLASESFYCTRAFSIAPLVTNNLTRFAHQKLISQTLRSLRRDSRCADFTYKVYVLLLHFVHYATEN